MYKHILYSFRRCPYAIRARWALGICSIKVNLREVDLKNKPKELIQKSSTKTVPLLILKNGTIIEESFEIVEWALLNAKDNIYEEYFPKNNKKEILEIIKENDLKFKFHLDRFKYAERYEKNEKYFHFLEARKFISKWNKILNQNSQNKLWLVGEKESIADWCIWPFIRQFKIACESNQIFEFEDHQSIRLWLSYFENHKYFKAIMHKYTVWNESESEKLFTIF